MNDLFGKFTITDAMRERAEEHKEEIESGYMDDMREVGIEFCDHFAIDVIGNFDMRGNPDGDMLLMYVAHICNLGLTVVLDGDVRWSTIDEFLEFIENRENYRISLEKRFKS